MHLQKVIEKTWPDIPSLANAAAIKEERLRNYIDGRVELTLQEISRVLHELEIESYLKGKRSGIIGVTPAFPDIRADED